MRFKFINVKYFRGKLKWWLVNEKKQIMTHVEDLPIRDYCFCTEKQKYALKLEYKTLDRDDTDGIIIENPECIISRVPSNYVFADHKFKDEIPYIVEFAKPYMKNKAREKIEKHYGELLFEADVHYTELVLKDKEIRSAVAIEDGKIVAIDDFELDIPHAMFDLEWDDRPTKIASSKKEGFLKYDVARILSCSFYDMKTKQVTFITDANENTLLELIKGVIYKYIRVEAWNGEEADYIMLKKRMLKNNIPFTWGRFYTLDAMKMHEMLNPKERKYLALDRIAQKYLEMNKIRHTEGFYEMFDLFHAQLSNKLETYNNRDVEIMAKLEDKFGFGGVVMETAFSVGCEPHRYTYARKPSQVLFRRRSMDHHNYRFIWKSKSDIPETTKPEGARVQDPISGRWKNVIAIDLASLYNNIIQTHNISPEQLRIFYDQEPLYYAPHDEGVDKEPIPIYPHDYKRFDQDGIGRTVLQTVELRRNEFKKIRNESKGDKFTLYDLKQQGEKAVLLSTFGGYGARGSTVSKEGGYVSGRKEFYDLYCVDDVMRYAREIIDMAVEVVDDEFYKVIYGDTDSIYISLGEGDLEQDEVKYIMDKLLQRINWKYKQWMTNHGVPKEWQKIKMEAQGYYSPFIVYDKKKNYFAREVWNCENDVWHEDFQLYGKGLKAFKPSATDFHKRFLKELYKMILTYKSRNEIDAFVRENRDKVFSGALEHELVNEKKLTKKIKEYKNATADVKYAATLIRAGKMQEKGAIYFKYGSHHKKRGVVCISEFDKSEYSGRKYFWNNHVKGDVDELLTVVYPIVSERIDEWF